jgi:hypothetical protein
MTFTSSKNNYNNIVKNRINKNMIKREDNNNSNIAVTIVIMVI